MSTSARIGINRLDDNARPVIRSIYCHYDGFLAGVGEKLASDFTVPSRILELIELGDISSLGWDLESTESYARDRGERLSENQAKTDRSIDDYKQRCYDVDYGYLYTNGEWWVVRHGGDVWEKLSAIRRRVIERV